MIEQIWHPIKEQIKPWISRSVAFEGALGVMLADQCVRGCFIDQHQMQINNVSYFQLADSEPANFIALTREKLQLQTRKKIPATLVLAPHQFQFFLIEDMTTEEKYKRESIQWRLTELLDYSVEEAIVDYIELPSKQNAHHKPLIYALAMHKDQLKEKMDWAHDCGLQLTKVDIWQNAIRRALTQFVIPNTGCLVLYIAQEKLAIAIFKENILCLMRDIVLPNQALCQNKKSDLMPFYESVCLEIQRSIDYCASVICPAYVGKVLIYNESDLNIDLSVIEKMLGFNVSHFPSVDDLFDTVDDTVDDTAKQNPITLGAAMGAIR